ncbi:Rs1 [Symbiodinium pilosum]|uniref:Rs1 protein n=1 Tax=Symbiodinium pilosum TaxID=2952 RepID=A0A812IST4_SYMPI|nr:Rs1 [Symbiodinium pilosum]
MPGGFSSKERARLQDYLSGRWTGFLNIKHAGHYRFFVSADDSVEVFLDGNLLLRETRCDVHRDLTAAVNLPAGKIPFLLQWRLDGNLRTNGDQRVLIPPSAFTHLANANTKLMTDASHTRGCVGNTGLASMPGSIFAPNGQVQAQFLYCTET